MDYLDIIKNRIRKTLDRARFQHSLRVEKTAVSLAEKYHAPVNKARLAGLLHDIAKPLNRKQLLSIAKKYRIKMDPIEKQEPKLLHAPASAILARIRFNIKDKSVLKAISHHTTGAGNMGLLEKIIFLADHIEPGRRFKGVDKIRQTAYRNINKAIILCCISMIEYLQRQKKPICSKTLVTLDYYL